MPPIFQKDPEHTVITFFNENSQENESTEDPEISKKLAASNLIRELAKVKKLGVLSKRTFREMEGKSVQSQTSIKCFN